MKFVWEFSDIKGGIRVKNPLVSEEWMIAYHPNPDHTGDTNLWQMVSLRDGLAMAATRRHLLVEWLNEHGYVPLKFLET